MEIRKNKDTRQTAGELWKKFLLSAVAEDMLMGEVADHLYLSDMDFKALSAEGEDYLISSVTETAFGDLVDEAAYDLSERAGEYRPWSDLSQYMGEEELGDALFGMISSRITCHSPREIVDNPYFRHIRVEGKTAAHHLALTVNDYFPGEFIQTYHEGFSEDDPFRAQTAGFFDGKVKFPVLLENGEVWMSLVLSEIESMRDPIAKAKGRVITYGLGLGYYAFMTSEKEDVDSVTVVELNPHVISLFQEKLLPQFPHNHKIHIISGDALRYVDSQKDGDFDYGFSDFWAGIHDGLRLYMDFMPRTARFRKTVHDYWIENYMAEYYFRPALMEWIMQEVLGKNIRLPGFPKKERRVMDGFLRFLSGEPGALERGRDMMALLKTENLVSLMRRFAVHGGR